MLRLLGLLLVWSYTGVGAVLLVSGPELGVRMLGLALMVLGVAWMILDVLRRTRVV
ncbi:hypothetical protein [Nocardioides bruguierae]|uniref:Uncharacterized protein n=1 Tax=Nocardioides bruguierae TaxID=2945102 RepID=A0A9X2DBU8_9ACTN|nr:hypothetical protein [Nocardioides bruguierae]MCM0622744.1 hypothetical protein [Nocardioides bruguierae]